MQEIYDLQSCIGKMLELVLKKTILYLPTPTPWAWVSRLRVENFDLTWAHACGPISHAWLKNVSCCRLAWHNLQKYVNSDPCKEWKPCVKWINGNTFLVISDFWSERLWEWAHIYTSDVFGRLWRTSLGIFGNGRVIFKNPSTPRIKIACLYLRKSWQVYHFGWSNCYELW